MAAATRAQKLKERVARAAQDTPEEAAIAQRMYDMTAGGKLDRIAADIKEEWGKGIESQFAIGRKLLEARQQFGMGHDGDHAFGQWFKAQEFQFGPRTAHNLRSGAEREPEIRAFLESRHGYSDIGVATAVQYISAGIVSKAKPVAAVGETAQVDQNYAALRAAHDRILGNGNGFIGMHVEDLAKSAKLIQALATAYAEARSKVAR